MGAHSDAARCDERRLRRMQGPRPPLRRAVPRRASRSAGEAGRGKGPVQADGPVGGGPSCCDVKQRHWVVRRGTRARARRAARLR